MNVPTIRAKKVFIDLPAALPFFLCNVCAIVSPALSIWHWHAPSCVDRTATGVSHEILKALDRRSGRVEASTVPGVVPAGHALQFVVLSLRSELGDLKKVFSRHSDHPFFSPIQKLRQQWQRSRAWQRRLRLRSGGWADHSARHPRPRRRKQSHQTRRGFLLRPKPYSITGLPEKSKERGSVPKTFPVSFVTAPRWPSMPRNWLRRAGFGRPGWRASGGGEGAVRGRASCTASPTLAARDEMPSAPHWPCAPLPPWTMEGAESVQRSPVTRGSTGARAGIFGISACCSPKILFLAIAPVVQPVPVSMKKRGWLIR